MKKIIDTPEEIEEVEKGELTLDKSIKKRWSIWQKWLLKERKQWMNRNDKMMKSFYKLWKEGNKWFGGLEGD